MTGRVGLGWFTPVRTRLSGERMLLGGEVETVVRGEVWDG